MFEKLGAYLVIILEKKMKIFMMKKTMQMNMKWKMKIMDM